MCDFFKLRYLKLNNTILFLVIHLYKALHKKNSNIKNKYFDTWHWNMTFCMYF